MPSDSFTPDYSTSAYLDLANNPEFRKLPEEEQIIERDLHRKAFLKEFPNADIASVDSAADEEHQRYRRALGLGRSIPSEFIKQSNILLPSQTPEYADMSIGEKEEAIANFRSKIPEMAAANPTQKEDTSFFLNRRIDQVERIALGEDTNIATDKLKRVAEGATATFFDGINMPDAADASRRFWNENPEYDDDWTAKLAGGAGSVVSAGLVMLGAAAATSAAGGTGAAPVIAGLAASGLTNVSMRYNEAYRKAIDMGLTDQEANSAGWHSTPAAVVDMVADKILVGKLLPGASKILKFGTTAEKAAVVAAATADSTIKKQLIGLGLGAVAEGTSELAGDYVAGLMPYLKTGREEFLQTNQERFDAFTIGAVLGGAAPSARLAYDTIGNKQGDVRTDANGTEIPAPTYDTKSQRNIAESVLNANELSVPENVDGIYELIAKGKYRDAMNASKGLLKSETDAEAAKVVEQEAADAQAALAQKRIDDAKTAADDLASSIAASSLSDAEKALQLERAKSRIATNSLAIDEFIANSNLDDTQKAELKAKFSDATKGRKSLVAANKELAKAQREFNSATSQEQLDKAKVKLTSVKEAIEGIKLGRNQESSGIIKSLDDSNAAIEASRKSIEAKKQEAADAKDTTSLDDQIAEAQTRLNDVSSQIESSPALSAEAQLEAKNQKKAAKSEIKARKDQKIAGYDVYRKQSKASLAEVRKDKPTDDAAKAKQAALIAVHQKTIDDLTKSINDAKNDYDIEIAQFDKDRAVGEDETSVKSAAQKDLNTKKVAIEAELKKLEADKASNLDKSAKGEANLPALETSAQLAESLAEVKARAGAAIAIIKINKDIEDNIAQMRLMLETKSIDNDYLNVLVDETNQLMALAREINDKSNLTDKNNFIYASALSDDFTQATENVEKSLKALDRFLNQTDVNDLKVRISLERYLNSLEYRDHTAQAAQTIADLKAQIALAKQAIATPQAVVAQTLASSQSTNSASHNEDAIAELEVVGGEAQAPLIYASLPALSLPALPLAGTPITPAESQAKAADEEAIASEPNLTLPSFPEVATGLTLIDPGINSIASISVTEDSTTIPANAVLEAAVVALPEINFKRGTNQRDALNAGHEASLPFIDWLRDFRDNLDDRNEQSAVDRMIVELATKNPDLRIVDQAIDGSSGFYDLVRNVIFIADRNMHTLAHEVSHALIRSDLKKYINRRSELTYTAKLNGALNDNATPQPIRDLIEAYLYAADKMGHSGFIGSDINLAQDYTEYAFATLDEFTAELYSNSEFQNELSLVPYKGSNVYKFIADALSRIMQWMNLVASPELILRTNGNNVLTQALIAKHNLIFFDKGVISKIKDGNNGKPKTPGTTILTTMPDVQIPGVTPEMQTQMAVSESSLSIPDRQKVSRLLGFKRWSLEVAKEYTERFLDFQVSGLEMIDGLKKYFARTSLRLSGSKEALIGLANDYLIAGGNTIASASSTTGNAIAFAIESTMSIADKAAAATALGFDSWINANEAFTNAVFDYASTGVAKIAELAPLVSKVVSSIASTTLEAAKSAGKSLKQSLRKAARLASSAYAELLSISNSVLSIADKAAAATALGFDSWINANEAFTERLANYLVKGTTKLWKLVKYFKKIAANYSVVPRLAIVSISSLIQPQANLSNGSGRLITNSDMEVLMPVIQEAHFDITSKPITNSGFNNAYNNYLATIDSSSVEKGFVNLFIGMTEQETLDARVKAKESDALKRMAEGRTYDVSGDLLPSLNQLGQRDSQGFIIDPELTGKETGSVGAMQQWVLEHQDNAGKTFIIADKNKGQIIIFDRNGNVIDKIGALFGRKVGDSVITDGSVSHRTPSGRFEGSQYQAQDYGRTVKFHRVESNNFSLHRIPSYSPTTSPELRKAAIASETPKDNRITSGCINLLNSDAVKVHDYFKDGGVVYILPETKQGIDTFKAFSDIEDDLSFLKSRKAKKPVGEVAKQAKKVELTLKIRRDILNGNLNDKHDASTAKVIRALGTISPSDVLTMPSKVQDIYVKIVQNIYESRKSAISNPQTRNDHNDIIVALGKIKQSADANAIQQIIESYEGVLNFSSVDITDRDAVEDFINKSVTANNAVEIAAKQDARDKASKDRTEKRYENFRTQIGIAVKHAIERFVDAENYVQEMLSAGGNLDSFATNAEMLAEHFNNLTTVDVSMMKGPELIQHFYAINNLIDGSYGYFVLTSNAIAKARNKTQGVSTFAGKFRDAVWSSSKFIKALDWVTRKAELYQVELQRLSFYDGVRHFLQRDLLGPLLNGLMGAANNQIFRLEAEYIAYRDSILGEPTSEDVIIMAIFGRLLQYDISQDPDSALLVNIDKERTSLENTANEQSTLKGREYFRNTIIPMFEKAIEGLEDNPEGSMTLLLNTLNDRMRGSFDASHGAKRKSVLMKQQDIFSRFTATSRMISEGFYNKKFKEQAFFVPNIVITSSADMDGGDVDLAADTKDIDNGKNTQGLAYMSNRFKDRQHRLVGKQRYSYNSEEILKTGVRGLSVDHAVTSEKMILNARLSEKSDLYNIIAIDESGVKHDSRINFIKGMALKAITNSISVNPPSGDIVNLLRGATNLLAKPSLSSIHHIITQPLAAALDYGVRKDNMTGWLKALSYYASNSAKVDDFFENTSQWTASRSALEAQGLKHGRNPGPDFEMKSKFKDTVSNIYEQAGKIMTFSIQNGDNSSTKATILAEYMRLMNEKGHSYKSFDEIDFENVDIKVLNDATLEAEKIVNTSNKALRGYLFSDRDVSMTVIRNMLFAFAAHSASLASQTTQAYRDIREIYATGAPKEELESKVRLLAAIGLQQIGFTAARFYIGGIATTAAIAAIQGSLGYDDDEVKKRQKRLALAKEAGDKKAVIKAEHELNNAKAVEKIVSKMKQTTQSPDSLFKQIIRDGTGAFNIVMNNGLAQKALFYAPDKWLGEMTKRGVEDQIAIIDKKIKLSKEDGDIDRVNALTRQKEILINAEYIPFAYEDSSSMGMGGIYGAVADSYKRVLSAANDGAMGVAEYSWNDLAIAAVAGGLGQAEMTKTMKAFDKVENEMWKNNNDYQEALKKNRKEELGR